MPVLSLKELGLEPAQARAIERRAKSAGQSLPEYVRSLLEWDLQVARSFDQILRPVRTSVKKRGISETEVEGIVDRARAAKADPRRARR